MSYVHNIMNSIVVVYLPLLCVAVEGSMNSIVISYVSCMDFKTTILSLENSSPGYDKLPASTAKQCIDNYVVPLTYIVQYKILLLVYKALNTGTPPYLAALLTRKSFCRVTRTSHKVNILNVPAHGKGCHSMKAFSVVGPTMWNELLTNKLRECTSVDVFKKRLKTHLFHLHY